MLDMLDILDILDIFDTFETFETFETFDTFDTFDMFDMLDMLDIFDTLGMLGMFGMLDMLDTLGLSGMPVESTADIPINGLVCGLACRLETEVGSRACTGLGVTSGVVPGVVRRGSGIWPRSGETCDCSACVPALWAATGAF